MEREYSLLIGALRTLNVFSENSEQIEFTYNYCAPGFSDLLKNYPVQEIAGKGNELDKALNLLRQCSENVLHNGGTKDVEFIPKTSLNILNYAYKKGWEYGVYCRLQAIVFTECCLALGIKSRILHCLPFGPYDFESHVISIVYIAALAYIDNHQDKKQLSSTANRGQLETKNYTCLLYTSPSPRDRG